MEHFLLTDENNEQYGVLAYDNNIMDRVRYLITKTYGDIRKFPTEFKEVFTILDDDETYREFYLTPIDFYPSDVVFDQKDHECTLSLTFETDHHLYTNNFVLVDDQFVKYVGSLHIFHDDHEHPNADINEVLPFISLLSDVVFHSENKDFTSLLSKFQYDRYKKELVEC